MYSPYNIGTIKLEMKKVFQFFLILIGVGGDLDE